MKPEDEKLLERLTFLKLEQHSEGYAVQFVVWGQGPPNPDSGKALSVPMAYLPIRDFKRPGNDNEICNEIDQLRLKVIKYLIKKGELKA